MNDDLDILISRYLDGTASADEVDRLDGLIARDRRVAAEVYRAASLDALLRDALVPSTTAPASDDAGAAESIRLPVSASDGDPQAAEPSGSARTGRLIHPARFRRPWAWAAAACLLVGAFVGWRLMRRPAVSPAPQIVMENAVPKVALGPGASIHGPARPGAARSNGTLGPNDELSTAAFRSSIGYDAEATRITIAPHSSIALLDASGKRFKLNRGRVDCDVEKQKPGQHLIIVTDQAEMTVIGTKFNVTTAGGWTRLQVTEGTVRVKRLTDGATVHVSPDNSPSRPGYVDVPSPGGQPQQVRPWAAGPPAGKDMSEAWSTKIRPAGIDQ